MFHLNLRLMETLINLNGIYIPYQQLIADLSANIVKLLSEYKDDPEFISQRKAFFMFGRANVERWRKEGSVQVYIRPGKVEYRTADLRLLSKRTQDYFKRIPREHTVICKRKI